MNKYKVTWHDPFWIVTSKQIKQARYYHYSFFKLIKIWLKMQFWYFYELYFKKCASDSIICGHFLNINGYCLRCKKTLGQIHKEIKIRDLENGKK